MRRLPKKKLRNLMFLFFGTGALGIVGGLLNNHMFITLMGASQLCVGGVFGWFFLTQEPPPENERKRRKRR